MALKTTLLKIAAVAAGITLALCIAAACALWYASRPKPSKPWNATALTVSSAPSFVTYGKELHIHLRYEVQNHTDNDYSIDKNQRVRVMGRYPNGSLTTPLEGDYTNIEFPVFVPAQHTGMMTLEITGVIPVAQVAKQSDEEYHEQLRDVLNKSGGAFDGFTVFDEDNHYQIDLPRWKNTKPEDKPQAKP
jgi:hypothetical protein